MSVETALDGLQKSVDDACGLIDKLRADREQLREALADVRELIYGYVDVQDGETTYGVPVANKAMRAVQRIDEVL